MLPCVNACFRSMRVRYSRLPSAPRGGSFSYLTARGRPLPQSAFRSRLYTSSTVAEVPPSVPRSRLRRFFSFCAISIFFTSAGFVMATAPAIPAINGFLNPPTDAETLTMFEPPNERSAEIDQFIKTHPVAQALRQNSDFRESRPQLKIPKAARQHNFSGGVLAGPGRIWVPPLAFSEKGGKSMTIIYYLGEELCGHPGIVHGGLLATILDEGMARCCFPALPNKIAMTASLTMNYRAPLPAGSYVCLRAETVKVEGRKAWVKGKVESLVEDGEKPNLFVEAEALFIEPKQAAAMARLYPVSS